MLLWLPQLLAESVGKRVVLILQSFPHIRFWERNGLWETTLRRETKHSSQVSREVLHSQGLKFDSRSPALELFLNAVLPLVMTTRFAVMYCSHSHRF